MPRKRNPIADDADPNAMLSVTVRFSIEQVRELDLRADAFSCDRADIVRMETLKGIGWIDKKRAEQQKKRVRLEDA